MVRVWLVVGVVFILGWIAVAFVRMVQAAFASIASGTADTLGRKNSRAAKLIEPPELVAAPIPRVEYDEVVRSLNAWQPPNLVIPHREWPVWQAPWTNEHPVPAVTVTPNDIEAIVRPVVLPTGVYDLLADPPAFSSADSFADYPDTRPPQPETVPETYPAPSLTLPTYSSRFESFNTYVRQMHAGLIRRFDELTEKQLRLQESAKTINLARGAAWRNACERHQRAKDRFNTERQAYNSHYMRARARFEQELADSLALLEKAKRLSLAGKVEGIHLHFDMMLRQLALPAFVPREWVLNFEPETGTLLVEFRLPTLGGLEFVSPVFRKHGVTHKPMAQSLRKALVAKIQPALCVNLARAIAAADVFGNVESVALNGWVDFFERATGQPKRAYCASVIATKRTLLDLRLETADVVTVFRSLGGANAGESYETAPVLPSLRLQTDDRRFVTPRETLEGMTPGDNLAAMDWEDFEHLVRQLFEREFAAQGAEVKVTRASRDQGVDAIIFDPDPLRGGKIIVQAKRYTIPVDVSAVRDLYGTVVNEGANTGILVTTSHFGPDAYQFAQNKPLKLLNGAQLLGLLEKAGYRFRIDVSEARALMSKPEPT